MYNFLGLSAQPVFSRTALEKIAQIFYKRNSLFEYIQGIFAELKISESLHFGSFIPKGKEKVAKYYHGFSWMGSMGITSNFLANNLENLVLLATLGVKLLLLFLLKKAFPELVRTLLGRLDSFKELFFVELICMSPLMTVSACLTVMDSGC